jgi:hypothetical protein
MNRRPLDEDPRGAATAGAAGPAAARVRTVPEASSAPDAPVDERQLDEILEDSFPASDPPPWTLGVVHAERTASR